MLQGGGCSRKDDEKRGVKKLESSGQDLSVKFGSPGGLCHVRSLGFA